VKETEITWVSDIKTNVVAIVKFGPPDPVSGFRPAEYYQVTIDVDRFSKSGEFIRFGTHRGDELVGWQRAGAISVVDILGDFTGDEETVIPWGKSPAVD